MLSGQLLQQRKVGFRQVIQRWVRAAHCRPALADATRCRVRVRIPNPRTVCRPKALGGRGRPRSTRRDEARALETSKQQQAVETVVTTGARTGALLTRNDDVVRARKGAGLAALQPGRWQQRPAPQAVGSAMARGRRGRIKQPAE